MSMTEVNMRHVKLFMPQYLRFSVLKWAKWCKSTANSTIVSGNSGLYLWNNMELFLIHPHICLLLLFSHSGVNLISCDMRKHVLCLSRLCQSSADSHRLTLLLLLLPQNVLSPTTLVPLPHIRCVYEHQNAIRFSKTPLVPRLVKPFTVVVHSEPSGC